MNRGNRGRGPAKDHLLHIRHEGRREAPAAAVRPVRASQGGEPTGPVPGQPSLCSAERDACVARRRGQGHAVLYMGPQHGEAGHRLLALSRGQGGQPLGCAVLWLRNGLYHGPLKTHRGRLPRFCHRAEMILPGPPSSDQKTPPHSDQPHNGEPNKQHSFIHSIVRSFVPNNE